MTYLVRRTCLQIVLCSNSPTFSTRNTASRRSYRSSNGSSPTRRLFQSPFLQRLRVPIGTTPPVRSKNWPLQRHFLFNLRISPTTLDRSLRYKEIKRP